MRLLTFATHVGGRMDAFLASCQRVQIAPQVVGDGEPYPGHTYRLKRLYPLVAALPAQDIVLFCDAYDSVVAGTEADILARYDALGSPDLLFGAETCCAPHPELSERYPPGVGRYRYLNAGGYIGRAGAIRRLWEDIGVFRLPDELNDQAAITDFFLTRPGRIHLDYEQTLLQNLYGAEDDLDVSSAPTFVNRTTGKTPVVFHGSGGARMDALYTALSL